MPSVETFFGPLIKGRPLFTKGMDAVQSGSNPFIGRTVVASGLLSVTVSTNLVNSNSVILTGIQASVVASSAAGQIDVTSVVPGVSFAFTRHNGVAAPFPTTIMWMIVGAR